jgi:hypothetical protein
MGGQEMLPCLCEDQGGRGAAASNLVGRWVMRQAVPGWFAGDALFA